MNKKFFTWMAGSLVLLATSVGAVGAVPIDPHAWQGPRSVFDVANATAIDKGSGLNAAAKGNLYQIAVTTVGGLNSLMPSVNDAKGNPLSGYTENGQWPLKTSSELSGTQSWSLLLQEVLKQSHAYMVYVDSLGDMRASQTVILGGNTAVRQGYINAPYQNSLFCVDLTSGAQDGSNPRIDITNRGTGLQVKISPTMYRTMGRLNAGLGYLGGWGFSNYYTHDIAHWMPLYTYMPNSNDTVYLFSYADKATYTWLYGPAGTEPDKVEDGAIPSQLDYGTGSAAFDSVTVVKWPVSKLKLNQLPNNALLFELVNPAPVFLTANMYNTLLVGKEAKARSLSFTPDKEQGLNPWTGYQLIAHDTTGFMVYGSDNTQPPYRIGGDASGAASNDPGQYASEASRWLYFDNGTSDPHGKWLFVDTLRNQTGTYYPTFAFGDSLQVLTYKYGGNLGSQGIFQLRYWYGTDSLSIDVAQSMNIPADYTGTSPWFDLGNSYGAPGGGVMPNGLTYDWHRNPYPPSSTALSLYGWKPYWDFYFPMHGMNDGERVNSSAQDEDLPYNAPAVYIDNTPVTQISQYKTATSITSDGDLLHVRLQDLTPAAGDAILTIGPREISTHIGMGVTGCTALASDLTTVPTDLYTIQNDKGEYLFVPIYTDSLTSNANFVSPKWESIDRNVTDPSRLPAYQWAVVKISPKSDKSALRIYNREFPEIWVASVQLKDKEGAPLFGDNVKVENFTPLSATVKADSTLGYFYVTPEQTKYLSQNTYVFNYYNALDNSRYLDVLPSEQMGIDSTLTLNGANGTQMSDKTLFQLHEVDLPSWDGSQLANTDRINVNPDYGTDNYGTGNTPEGIKAEKYGYSNEDSRFVGNDTIPGLKPLWREAFALQVKDATRGVNNGRYVTVGNQTRYTVKPAVDLGGTATVPDFSTGNYSVFFLKTHNTVDGKDYYAFLDISQHTDANTPGKGAYANYKDIGNDVKLGVEDATLWGYVQTFNEQRTSTFSVETSNEPLYRRFDGGTYGATTESFGDSKNAPQWLRFTRQNNYGHEFLFENSPLGLGNSNSKDNMGKPVNDYRQDLVDSTISFLGLYNIDQYPESLPKFGYTFYVDTAYSMRPTANQNYDSSLPVASQYTLMPQYMLAVRPDINPGGWEREVITQETWDSEGNYHKDTISDGQVFTPSYTRGYWLFNAQDSVGGDTQDYTYIDNTSQPNLGKNLSGYSDYVGRDNYGGPAVTRLAFVDGVHLADTFYVLRGVSPEKKLTMDELAAIPARDKIYLGQNTHYSPRFGSSTWMPVTGKVGDDVKDFNWGNARADKDHPDADVNGYRWDYPYNGKSMVFEFRLYDPEGKLDNGDRRFFIESQSAYTSEEVAPSAGRWVKIQNGVPVMTDMTTMTLAKQNGLDVFNVMAGDSAQAVANEAAPEAVGTVKVISGEGNVTVLNASGKTVTVSNILGQTIAKQTISSDAATITLPKGIVIVTVEGEPAVKAIVR